MNIDAPETRIAIKRFIALIRWCEHKKRHFPDLLYVATTLNVVLTFLESIIYTLRRNKIIKIVGGYGGKLHYRMVN